MRLSAAQLATKASMTATIASFPPSRSYSDPPIALSFPPRSRREIVRPPSPASYARDATLTGQDRTPASSVPPPRPVVRGGGPSRAALLDREDGPCPRPVLLEAVVVAFR